MALDIQTNADEKANGTYRPGSDLLLDDKGNPIRLKVSNMWWKAGYPEKVRRISNERIEDTSTESVRMAREIAPIREWRTAKPGTNHAFSGILEKTFPELGVLSAQRIDKAVESLRRRELED